MVLTTHKVQGNDPMYTLPQHAKDGIREAIATMSWFFNSSW